MRSLPVATRVLVYGDTGSGKSTLAAQIAERTGLPWHSVDDVSQGGALGGSSSVRKPGSAIVPDMLLMGVVVLGVEDRERAAAFWRQALGYERSTDGFGGWSVVLVPPVGSAGAMLAFQISDTPPQDHPRLHLDLHVQSAEEQAKEADRLVSIGALRVDWDDYPDDPDFVVLEDPEGNRFCIVDVNHGT
jgi:catechol 2,3-dioxygenase-like lactoylglutathione lyase family enzyme